MVAYNTCALHFTGASIEALWRERLRIVREKTLIDLTRPYGRPPMDLTEQAKAFLRELEEDIYLPSCDNMPQKSTNHDSTSITMMMTSWS